MIKVFILVVTAALSQGYPFGAPLDRCVSMTPGHNAVAQTTDPPFTISVDRRFYKRGDNILVTLNATRSWDVKVKGFMLSARLANCSEPDKPVGMFSLVYPDPDVKLLTCNGLYKNNTVTHANRNEKTSKTFLWRNDAGGDVYFRFTVVQNTATFWDNITSGVLYDQSSSSNYTTCADKAPIHVHDRYLMTTMGYPKTTMPYDMTPWDGKWPVASAVKQNMSIFVLLGCVALLFL